MSQDKTTTIFSIVIIAAIIIFDVWTLLERGYTTTISWQLYERSKAEPIIPLAIGVVIGHLWWPNKAEGADAKPEG